MGQPFFDRFADFRDGVITAEKADKIPPSASPRGRNSYLIAGIGASAAKRRGASTVNTTTITSGIIAYQHQYKKLSAGAFTRYHILVGSDGRIGTIASDPGGSGTYTSITTGVFTTNAPDFADAENLCFIANGVAQKKFDGTNLQMFGIVAPSTAPSLASGAAGTPSGTYEARVTYYNSATGHESSAGPTSSTVTVTSQKIEFTSIPVSGDSQVTSRKLYLRNTATMANFYLATTINDNSTTTFSYNQADTLLVLLGPNTTENNVVPSDVKYLAWHKSRMFAASDTDLNYSKIEKPESFDTNAFEPVDPDNSQKIKGILSYNGILLVFKERSMYGLYGVNPESWSIELISADTGCTSHRSISVVEGILYWWSDKGPMRWTGAGLPEPIGLPFISGTLTSSELAIGEYDDVCSAPIYQAQVLLFGTANSGDTRNTRPLAYSYRLNRWVSDGWTGIEAGSLCAVEDANLQQWTYYSNYNGQIFRFWDTDTDGVPSGTVTGTFVAAGASHSTITSSGFYTTGTGLAHRYVAVEDSNRNLMGHVRITSNSGTVLTLTSNVTGLTTGATYTFHVGGPCFEWDTKWEEGVTAFLKKRYEHFFIQAEDTAASVYYLLYRDFLDIPSRFGSMLTTSSTKSVVTKRFSAQFTGVSWKARLLNRAANAPVILYEVGMKGETATSKIN